MQNWLNPSRVHSCIGSTNQSIFDFARYLTYKTMYSDKLVRNLSVSKINTYQAKLNRFFPTDQTSGVYQPYICLMEQDNAIVGTRWRVGSRNAKPLFEQTWLFRPLFRCSNVSNLAIPSNRKSQVRIVVKFLMSVTKTPTVSVSSSSIQCKTDLTWVISINHEPVLPSKSSTHPADPFPGTQTSESLPPSVTPSQSTSVHCMIRHLEEKEMSKQLYSTLLHFG